MAIYLLYVISPVFVWAFLGLFKQKSLKSEKKRTILFLIICGILMTLMIGLRNKSLGSEDTLFYYRNWEWLSRLSWNDLLKHMSISDLEYGYQIYTWSLSQIFPNGQWALIFSGALFASAVCVFTYKNSKNPVISLIVFHCLGLFNFMVQGLRQAIAMSICLFAYEQCKKRHFFRFILLVLLASLFHASAVVFAVVYFLRWLKLDLKSLAIFSVLTFIALLLLPTIFDFMNFVMDEEYDMVSEAEGGGLVAILIYAVIILFGLIFKDRSDKHYPLFIYSAIVAAVAMILRNSISAIVERISFYFAFGQMIVLSNSISSLKEPRERVLLNVAAIALCFGVAIYKASYSELIPYTFFWQL